MKIVIVYESMFGNTHLIADAIAKGLGPENQTVVVPVDEAQVGLLDGVGLVVVGGSTHVRSVSPASTRMGGGQPAVASCGGAVKPGMRMAGSAVTAGNEAA